MKTALIALLFGIIVLTIVGCGKDPRQVRITEKNRYTFLADIKDMKGLTVEEVFLLTSAQMSERMKGHSLVKTER